MKIFLIYILIILCNSSAAGKTWVTAIWGDWNNPWVWVGNVVPPYESKDNFVIKHHISFDKNLVFTDGSEVTIESSGALCGHKTVTVSEGCYFQKNGDMYCDTLIIHGAQYIADSPGRLMVSAHQKVEVGKGDALFSKRFGCAWCVKCYFSCTGEQGFHASSVEPFSELDVAVFPNPASDKFNIKANEYIGECKIRISDLQGKKILSTSMVLDESGIEIPLDLENGLYFYEIIAGNRTSTGKLQIIR